MDAAAVLAELFVPLRFAARDGFRGAATLRDLSRLAQHAASRGRSAGLDPALLDDVVRAAGAFDAAPAEGREPAVKRVLAALARLAPLPPDLAQIAGVPVEPPGEARPPPGPPASEAPPGIAPRRAAPRRAEEPEPSTAPVLPGPDFTRGPLARPITGVPGVGPRTAELLAKKGVTRVGHALFLLPRGYQDRRHVATIRELSVGQKGLVLVEVVSASEMRPPRGRRLLRVVVRDATGKMALTFFHYWASTIGRLTPGRRFFAWGDVKLFGGVKQIVHPELEDADDDEGALHRGRIVPVYRGMDDVGQGRYRGVVRHVLDAHLGDVPEILPAPLRARRALPEIREALAQVHFPPEDADAAALAAFASKGHRRLIYEELLLISVGLALKARGIQVEPGHRFDTSPERIAQALARLPFTPTGAQRRAIEAIAADMALPAPMNRLLQGDVGSGKTAVALVACLLAVNDGRQAAVMAPTELLAEQHHRTFTRLLEGTGVGVALLAAGRGAKLLAGERSRVASGEARIAVGTHALFTEDSLFQELGLAVIDEQHRFGVEQRARLIYKGRRPDVLVMTATPIPRTLALVLHGELTQTVIDELPPGRTPVTTRVFDGKRVEKAHELIGKELAKGRQAYVVYPLIEESESSDLADATTGLRRMRARFPDHVVELIHGRLKAEERDRIMDRFRSGEVHVLVATTVIEVGVDVPNASVMLIEHAERFGLSQLHQLRGRVGRGAARSYCLLVAHGGRGEKAAARLKIMEETTDGFRIAQEDLEIRGPGEFLGTRQAGLPELTFADLSRDARLLEEARADAFALVAADPDLRRPEHELLREEVFTRFAERMSLARVG